MTKKINRRAPIKAITGAAPKPGTTFPWPELPIDFRKLPKAVFCPIFFVFSFELGLIFDIVWELHSIRAVNKKLCC